MKNQLNKIAKDTNLFLKKYIQEQENSKLIYAMKYGLFPGGKKIRSKILIDIGSLFSINYHTLIAIGAAVECIHAYSLIHDDLPCMDNDVMNIVFHLGHVLSSELLFDCLNNGRYICIDPSFGPVFRVGNVK